MKSVFFILGFAMVSMMYGQETVLEPFNIENATIKNPVYHYITENYDVISDKEKLPSNGVGDCGFKQSFTKGVTYTKRNCGDAILATGELITVTNPDRASVIRWVESLNRIYSGFEDHNQWNFDQTEYRPVSNVPGAFFEIHRDHNTTTVLIMSGC